MSKLIGIFDAKTGQYIEREATEDEVAADEVGILEAATQKFYDDRTAKLAETDWWAVRASEPGGTPMTDAQLAYRAALRTMDNAEGFDVFNPAWPEMPA